MARDELTDKLYSEASEQYQKLFSLYMQPGPEFLRTYNLHTTEGRTGMIKEILTSRQYFVDFIASIDSYNIPNYDKEFLQTNTSDRLSRLDRWASDLRESGIDEEVLTKFTE